MNIIRNFSIVASFVGLWVSSLFPSDLEILMGFILIFSFGIFHGSNDISLITSFSTQNSSNFSLKVLVIYIATVLFAVIVLYFLPSLALIAFVLFSAFHFGEQQHSHWPIDLKPIWTNLYYVVYGLLILLLQFIINPEDVIAVVEAITSHQISTEFISTAFYISLVAYLLFTAVLYLKNQKQWKYFAMELLYLGIFAIIFEVSSLIWGFTIYFIFWHSIPSSVEQVNFLYGSFNGKHLLAYVKNAFWYWLISLIGIAILYFIFGENTLFYAIMFSFIAAVTFPHTLVINTMFKTKKTQPNS